MCVFVCVCDVFMDKEVLKNNSCEFRGQGASVAILKADLNRIFFHSTRSLDLTPQPAFPPFPNFLSDLNIVVFLGCCSFFHPGFQGQHNFYTVFAFFANFSPKPVYYLLIFLANILLYIDTVITMKNNSYCMFHDTTL